MPSSYPLLHAFTMALFLVPTVPCFLTPYPLPAQAQTSQNRRSAAIRLNNEGQQLQVRGQFREAMEKFQQALTIVREIGERQGEAMILNQIGGIYGSLGQYPKALELHQQALAIHQELGGNRKSEGTTLNYIGFVYDRLGEYPKALEYYQQALTIRRQVDDREGEGTTLNNIGWIYDSLGQYPKALEYYQQAFAILKQIGDREGEGTTLNNIGGVYDSLGQYAKALEYYQQAFAILKQIGNRRGEGTTLNNIGLVYDSLGQYAKALEYYQQSLAIRKDIGDRRGEGTMLNNIGGVYDSLGQYAKALEYYQQSLAIRKDIGDRRGEGTTLNNIGFIYDNLGQYAKALEFYQQALAIRKDIGNRSGEAQSLNNIGFIYSSLGQYAKALEFYQQAFVIRKDIGDREGEAQSLNNIGGIYSSVRQYAKALEFYQQAFAIRKDIGDREGEAQSLNNIGSIYDRQGQSAKALEFYQQSLVIRQDIGDRSGEGQSLNNIGGIYSSLGQYPKALEYYQQALAIVREIGDRAGEATTLNNVGASLLRSGKALEAEATLFAAIEVFESLRPGLADENKVSLLDTRVTTYHAQQQALIVQNKIDTALEVAERGRARAFVELLATRLQGTEAVLPELTEGLRPTITQIRQIAQEHNSTLIQYSIIDPTTLYIWVVQPSGKVTHRQVALSQSLSLSELIDTSRAAIGVRGRGSFRIELKTVDPSDRLKQLHQLLIEPIADLLPTDPNAPVIFVPYGELFLVPFPALQDASGKYLIEKHTILTAPSIQVLGLTRQKLQQVKQAGLRDILIVGNPTMPKVAKPGETPEQLKALAGAEREANTIATLFKTKALTGKQATKAAIVPQLSQARIIHLATHGLLDDLQGLGTPGAIALAPSGTGEPNDGLLTANEILDLKLNAELVVLSACDTGRGRITSDSVIGLSRSLIIAGTPSVIVSLWSVPDAPTAELMTEFYRNWQEKKLDKAQALRQAMLTIMKRPNAKPRDWAAFTLIGEAE